MNEKGTILVAGAVAQRIGYGGHVWAFLQYLLGFRRLGWDVIFIDRIDLDAWRYAKRLPELMQRAGLGDRFALLDLGGSSLLGLSRADLLERAKKSAMLLNVMGYLRDPEILASVGRRVFLDIDPGFGQMWRELGQHDLFAGHDRFVTVGANVGAAGSDVPTCGLEWITTLPPIVLEQWPMMPISSAPGEGDARFTTIASWRGPFAPIEFRGRTYGLRVHEFRRYFSLPRKTSLPFELALDIHPNESRDLTLLRDEGWRLVDPCAVAGDPWRYREYVQQSAAEICVAKNLYVQTRGGWFSDRSVCYLASGKPVLAQDTSFRSSWYRGDDGLVSFTTPDDAADGAKRIAADYAKHCRAARAVAEEYFDSDKVLERLLTKLGI